MFTKNTYLLPQVPSSASGVEIFLHHHHHPELYGHYLTSSSNAPLLNHENSGGGGGGGPSVPAKKQTAAKKDRHSKIYTAQGPRDRRVRLSIGIARKFFDLQEMLGFDKPSKTLDWLLTKSKAAIKELVQSKHKTSSAAAASDCELAETSADSKAKEKGGGASTNLAKESRAKARARARERTREKMCIKQLNITSGFPVPLIQNRNNHLEFMQLSAGNKPLHSPLISNQDESAAIKRKTKTASSFQQNVIVSNSASNYAIPSENWDVCNFSSQSSMYAILDQHKFNSNI